MLELQALLVGPLYSLPRFHPQLRVRLLLRLWVLQLVEPHCSLRHFHLQLQVCFLLEDLRTPQAYLPERLRLHHLLVEHHQLQQHRRLHSLHQEDPRAGSHLHLASILL